MQEIIKKVKENKIIRIFIISLLISIFIELFIFNINRVINENYNEELVVLKYKNFKYDNGYYVSTKDNSQITVKNNKKYINKISFEYIANNDFKYDILSTKQTENIASDILNKATRKVTIKNNDNITLKFYNKGIKIRNIRASNELVINYYRIFYIFIVIFTFTILIKYYKYFKEKEAYAFLLIGGLLGILMLIISPLTLVISSDDQVHYKNMYTLLDGEKSDWTYSGRYYNHVVLKSYEKYKTIEEINDYKNFLNKNNNKESVIKMDNSDYYVDYNEIVYLPFAIGNKIGKILGFNFVNNIIIAKLFNLIVYLTIMFFAIKLAPFLKRLIFVIGLLPSNIYLATQFSYDSTITAGLILGFVAFLKLKSQDKISFKYLMTFILATLWACLPKAIYCPMLLLIFLIPNEKFESNKSAKIVKIGTLLLFLILLSTFVLPASFTEAGDSRVVGTSVSGQLHYILSSPFGYIKLLVKEFIGNFNEMFFGYNTFSLMGYLNENNELFNLTNFILSILIFYLTLKDSSDKEVVDKKLKIVLIGILIVIWTLIWTALYLSWTPVASTEILGVQSRYFLPILFPLLLVFTTEHKKKIKDNLIIYLTMGIVLSYSILYILFYIYR